MITGLTRVRNESLIIEDTLRHMLGYCESIIAYDDASTDNTAEIMASFDRVHLIQGKEWRKDRAAEETRHRAILLQRSSFADWCFYFDADERPVGELPDMTADAYRLALYDGYMTPDRQEPYTSGPLVDLPRMWGPERRDIVILFRPGCARFAGRDQREPRITGRVEDSGMLVKHYGKCLSVEHWEETCDYYANDFGGRYRDKWAARRGKAIHTASDDGRELLEWETICKS